MRRFAPFARSGLTVLFLILALGIAGTALADGPAGGQDPPEVPLGGDTVTAPEVDSFDAPLLEWVTRGALAIVVLL